MTLKQSNIIMKVFEGVYSIKYTDEVEYYAYMVEKINGLYSGLPVQNL